MHDTDSRYSCSLKIECITHAPRTAASATTKPCYCDGGIGKKFRPLFGLRRNSNRVLHDFANPSQTVRVC